ncbi:MAG: DNA alkylation repair protein [Pseudomonadota bacterium]
MPNSDLSGDQALSALRALGDTSRAAAQAAYHKSRRLHLGVSNGDIDRLVKGWRGTLDMSGRVSLADALWRSDIHEARIAAGKLLTQARIPDDGQVWALITSWVPDFDAWAIADHSASAGARRLTAHPERLDEVGRWTTDPNLWTRRAALVFTLPWSKGRHPSAADLAHRERILGWAAGYVPDHEWFIQKAVAWWLRSLSKRDPERVRAFLAEYGNGMKAFARKEAEKYL